MVHRDGTHEGRVEQIGINLRQLYSRGHMKKVVEHLGFHPLYQIAGE